jgi:hypothetical protein
VNLGATLEFSPALVVLLRDSRFPEDPGYHLAAGQLEFNFAQYQVNPLRLELLASRNRIRWLQ